MSDKDQNRDQERKDAGDRSPKVGALLRASRLRVGEDLRDISDVLCIRYLYLEAIEDCRYGDLPGNTYAVGFIRSYAEHLGLDGDEVVRRYRLEQTGQKSATDLAFPTPVPDSGVPKGAIVFIGVLLALLVYGGWYVTTTDESILSDLISPVPDHLKHLVTGDDAPSGAPSDGVPPSGTDEAAAVTESAAEDVEKAVRETTTAAEQMADAAGEAAQRTAEAAVEAATAASEAVTGTAGTAADSASETADAAATQAPQTTTAASESMTEGRSATTEGATTEGAASTAATAAGSDATVPAETAESPPAATTDAVPSAAATASAPATGETGTPAPTAMSAQSGDTATAPDGATTAPEPAAEDAAATAAGQSASGTVSGAGNAVTSEPLAAPSEAPAPGRTASEAPQTATPSASSPEVTAEDLNTLVLRQATGGGAGGGVDTDTPAPPETASRTTGGSASASGVVIRATSSSWVEIRDPANSTIVYTGLMSAGNTFNVPDTEGLVLDTGNAGALDISVGGEPVPKIGGVGAVRKNVSLDAERLKAGTAANR